MTRHDSVYSETLEHFLLGCNVLAETPEPYISELNVLIKECHSCVKCNATNTCILNLHSILDPSHKFEYDSVHISLNYYCII
jgi:multimeric flavodoxin WrbA